MSPKIVFTLTPAAVTPTMATSAISATSSAYSSRSWPSSRRVQVLTYVISAFIMSSAFRVLERGRDVAEDRVHLDAGGSDAHDGDERDQRHEQRVLEQVLPFLATNERTHTIHEIHRFLRARCF